MRRDIKSKIREVADWPKKGVSFKDITTLLGDGKIFKEIIDDLSGAFKKMKPDKVVGIDARGFLFASPVAYKLGAGLAIARKPGKLPYMTIEQKYTLEYGSTTVQMHVDSIRKGEKVLLIDDLIATGGTAVAVCDLIEKLGGKIVGAGFVINLPFLGGEKILKDRGYKVISLAEYDSE
jgi:adenine phosphoribosyltransferase